MKEDKDEYGPLMDMHPHTMGKLDLVRQYYRKALPIFSQQAIKKKSSFVIVDGFCGSGSYNDIPRTSGSPIVILEEWDAFLKLHSSNAERFNKTITFIFNDNNLDTINSLESRVKASNNLSKYLNLIEFRNNDFSDLVEELLEEQKFYGYGSYFIDPYGYKDIHIPELALLSSSHGHEVIVNWMFENIAKYAFSQNSNDPSQPHPATIMLNELFGKKWLEALDENTRLSDRKEKLTTLFVAELKSSMETDGSKAYVIPFLFYKDGNRVWYPMFHACTSPRGAQAFDNACKKVGANLRKFQPVETKNDSSTTSLDDWFTDDPSADVITSADLHIKNNIEFFIDNFLDLFDGLSNNKLKIGNVYSEVLRTWPQRQASGNSKVPVKWTADIIPRCLRKYPDYLSIWDWDGNRKLRKSDYIIYKQQY